MLQALNTDGCDLIGIGRPLCGNPDASMEILNSRGDDAEMPRYEGTLIVGKPWIYHNFLNNKRWWGWFKMLPQIVFIGKQYWYYMQIIEIGRTGNVNHKKWGCFAAAQANLKHEAECARNLIGIKAVGSVYNKGGDVDNPPMTVSPKKKKGSMMGKVVGVLMIGVSVYYYKYYYSQGKKLDLASLINRK